MGGATLIFYVETDQHRYWIGVNPDLGTAVIDTTPASLGTDVPDNLPDRIALAMRLFQQEPLPTTFDDISEDDRAELMDMDHFSFLALGDRWVGEVRVISFEPVDPETPDLQQLQAFAAHTLAGSSPRWKAYIEKQVRPQAEA